MKFWCFLDIFSVFWVFCLGVFGCFGVFFDVSLLLFLGCFLMFNDEIWGKCVYAIKKGNFRPPGLFYY